MAAPKKVTKIKTNAIDAPVTQEQAEALLLDIGKAQREVARIEADMNDHLAEIKDGFEKAAQPYNEDISEKFSALHIWAEAHKDELLKGKLKTAKISTGELSWRTTPPRVSVRGKDEVIEMLKRMKLTHLIRTTEDINKEAILNEPEAIKGIAGVSIVQKEEFAAKSFESQIERVMSIKKK